LFNRHWGEQIVFGRDNTIRIAMVFQGPDRQQAAGIWSPFLDWVSDPPQDFFIEQDVMILDLPARQLWDAEFIRKNLPDAIVFDDRPGTPEGNFFWAADHGQVGQVLHGYQSVWLSASLLRPDRQADLVDALFACSRHRGVSLHFNKGLAGAPAEALAAAQDTATNPAVLDAFALAIIAAAGPPAFPGIAGHEPDVPAARQHAREIGKAMDELRKVLTDAGSYVAESDFFEHSWQQSFWGQITRD
jgi:hypothetical protein